MEKEFRIEGEIATLKGALPVRFVHQRGMDRPENHVLHINNYLEVYVFLEGHHQYIVENRVYELQRGDMVLINPREVHKALPLETCMYERVYLLVDEHCLDALVRNPLAVLLNRSGGNLISPPEPVRRQVLDLLEQLSLCFRRERDDQTQGFGLVLQLLELCVGQSPVEGKPGRVPQLLEKILAYVAENTASIQSTAEVATALGLSPQYLSAYFSRHIGTPLKIYIQAKKIALAKDLLSKGADVTGACFDSGFNDCSYFIRVFKHYVGVTPLRYRQDLRR